MLNYLEIIKTDGFNEITVQLKPEKFVICDTDISPDELDKKLTALIGNHRI